MSARVAVVTGAASGIGMAVARHLRAAGVIVAACDLAPVEGCVELDVTDADAVAAFIAGTEERHGGIDILVANAGVAAPYTPLIELPEDQLRRVVEVNIFGAIYCVRATIPAMRRRGGGRVVLMASQLGKTAWPGWAAYSGTKAFVIALAQALALEHAADGVLVNAICPGNIDTPMLQTAFAARAAGSADGGSAKDELISQYVADRIPVGRIGDPDDVANAVGWLISDAATFTTGTALNLTGGEMLF